MLCELLVGIRKITDESLIEESDVKIGEMADDWFSAFNYLLQNYFETALFMGFFEHMFFFKIDVFLFAGIHEILKTFFFLPF